MLKPFQLLDLYLGWRRKRRTRAGEATDAFERHAGQLLRELVACIS